MILLWIDDSTKERAKPAKSSLSPGLFLNKTNALWPGLMCLAATIQQYLLLLVSNKVLKLLNDKQKCWIVAARHISPGHKASVLFRNSPGEREDFAGFTLSFVESSIYSKINHHLV